MLAILPGDVSVLQAKRLPARLSRHHAVRAAMGETSTPPSATTAVPPELWWKAIKLPIFTVALVPLSVSKHSQDGFHSMKLDSIQTAWL